MSDNWSKEKRIEAELEMVHADLEAAQLLIEEGYRQPGVNRLYYACFHVVSAVLLERGFDPDTHSGVQMLFGREVVKPGDTPDEHGKFLRTLFEARQIADYDGTTLDISNPPLETDIETLCDRVEEFVTDMEALIE